MTAANFTFKWRDGFHKRGDAQSVGEALQVIRETRGLTAPNVVEAMQEPGSPLRPYFTLDIHRAAQERWLDQARELIRAVAVVIDFPGIPETITAYAAIGAADEKYVPMLEALSQKDTRDRLLAAAAAELSWFVQKFEALKELAGRCRTIRGWLSRPPFRKLKTRTHHKAKNRRRKTR